MASDIQVRLDENLRSQIHESSQLSNRFFLMSRLSTVVASFSSPLDYCLQWSFEVCLFSNVFIIGCLTRRPDLNKDICFTFQNYFLLHRGRSLCYSWRCKLPADIQSCKKTLYCHESQQSLSRCAVPAEKGHLHYCTGCPREWYTSTGRTWSCQVPQEWWCNLSL